VVARSRNQVRIAQIVPSLEERHGGPSKSVRRLAAALARLGHEVDLLTSVPGEESASPPEAGLRVHQFGRAWPDAICRAPALREHLRRHDYECLHHHALWLRTLHYANEARARTGAAFIISPRGMASDWAWAHRRWKKRLAGRLIHPGALASADGWHATSGAEADDLRRRGFTQPVCVAPNGVEVPSGEEMNRAREAWAGLCPEARARPVALFYSRFHPKKRVRELLELWANLAPKDWLLLVAGIPQAYTVAELQALARQRGAADRIAVVDSQNHPPPYGLAALFLLPSHSENFGLVVAEAMAWGVPVLVTDTTPWAEAAARNAGWCVPWASYGQSLREALGESAERLEQRGAHARDWMTRAFSWDQAAKTLADFYGRISGRRP